MQSIRNAQKATSLPTSPVSKPVTIKSTPTPQNFFTFRWLFRGSKKSSSKKKSKQSINKNEETFVSLTDPTKILSRQSYSFDDIQQFLINNTEQKAMNPNQINSYKSNLEIAIKTNGNKKKCLTYFTCKLCLTNKSSYEMHSIWSCGCAFCKPVSIHLFTNSYISLILMKTYTLVLHSFLLMSFNLFFGFISFISVEFP
jgi:hypothetical protein